MAQPAEIRPVRRDDFAEWKELWDGYNAFYGRSGSTALPPDVTRTTWSRFFDEYEPMHALIAESCDKSPTCYLAMKLYDKLAEKSGFVVYRRALA